MTRSCVTSLQPTTVTAMLSLALGATVCPSAYAQTAAAPGMGVSAPATADGEVLVYSQFLSSRHKPESLGDAAAAAVANPVIGPVLIIGAAYFGVPPGYVAAAGAAAAKAQQEKSEATRKSPRKGYHVDTFVPPAGYDLCAIRVGALSIHPRFDKRPKVRIVGSRQGVVVESDHVTQDFGSGRSTVKLVLDFMAVKSDARDKYAEKCLAEKPVELIGLCRGAQCEPSMTRSTWLSGR